MATITKNFTTDENTVQEAEELLAGLGIDLSTALNIFLKQVCLRGRIPFDIAYPSLRPEVAEAIKEAEALGNDPNTKRYGSWEEALADIDFDEDSQQ